MPAEPTVEAHGLGHHYGRQRALAGVDLTVPTGATCAVMGPNGAGKSTLLRLLAGLLAPTGGELRLFGQPAQGDRPDLRRRIGLLGHESFLYARLTAAENLVFYATLYGLDRTATRAEAALAEVGLAGSAGRPAGALSRGLRQRLALARVMLHAPELVLLDEPYTGLDPAGEAVLDRFLARLRAERRTVLFATHRPDKAARADLVVYLARGRRRELCDARGDPLAGAAAAAAAARLGRESPA
ncbi:MAG: heme ABC exporter ATP-binding protein CcmA [Candidatus Krumholzibacteriia bacterium]